jgi:hypothetical protein
MLNLRIQAIPAPIDAARLLRPIGFSLLRCAALEAWFFQRQPSLCQLAELRAMPENSKDSKVKGRTTFRIAAVFFLLSAVLELVGIFSAVPLLGAFRGGWVAAAYHLFFAALYLALGIGLWKALGWGYRLVFTTTLVYTVDKLQYVIYRQAILVEMMRKAGPYRQLLEAIDRQMFLQVVMLVAALFAAGWWGFAAYTYFRRDYFRSSNPY